MSRKSITINLPTMEEVQFFLAALPEDCDPEGHFASGDDEQDAKDVAEIRRKSEFNEWAWCIAEIKCTWGGLTGDSLLGGCSYDSAQDFMAAGGYWEDMKQTAYDDLISQIMALEKASA